MCLCCTLSVGLLKKLLQCGCNFFLLHRTTQLTHTIEQLGIVGLHGKFEQVFREYGALLSRVASSYEANEALQQELLQEIAVAVWQAMSRFKGNSSVKTYVLKVAHNRAVSHVASQVRHPRTEEYVEENSPASEGQWSPETSVEQQKSLERLLSAVRELPLPGRQVLTLSLEGLSYDEIAEVCGLTTNHVGVLLKRAKTAINRNFQHDDA